MDIHCDVVCSVVGNKFWNDYTIDYGKLRSGVLYGVATSVPSDADIRRILESEYGKSYLIPNKRSPLLIGYETSYIWLYVVLLVLVICIPVVVTL